MASNAAAPLTLSTGVQGLSGEDKPPLANVLGNQGQAGCEEGSDDATCQTFIGLQLMHADAWIAQS